MLLHIYIFYRHCHKQIVGFSLSRFEMKGNRNAKTEHSEQLNAIQQLCRTVKII
jgi:hypothetical protein